MAEIDAWTKAARTQKNNSVLLAVPASSRPSDVTTAAWMGMETTLEAGVVGAAIGAAMLAGATVLTGIRRLKERNKRFGDRKVNDKVVALFYPDRVDLHDRPSFRKSIGKLRESVLLDAVARPEDPQLLAINEVQWTLQPFTARKLDEALTNAGISLPE